MISNLPLADLLAAVECIRARNRLRLLSMALASLTLPFPIIVLVAIAADGWDSGALVPLLGVALVWGLVALIYFKPYPIFGFLIAGVCFLGALCSIGGIVAILASGPGGPLSAEASSGAGLLIGLAGAFGYEGLRQARSNWRVLELSKQPGVAVAVEEVLRAMKHQGSECSPHETLLVFPDPTKRFQGWRIRLDDGHFVLAIRNRRHPLICAREAFNISPVGRLRERGRSLVRIRLQDQVLETKLHAHSLQEYQQWQAKWQQSADRGLEIRKEGDPMGKRLEQATGGDIALSIMFPGWGVLIGLIALIKGERKRAGTMIGLGVVLLVLWSITSAL